MGTNLNHGPTIVRVGAAAGSVLYSAALWAAGVPLEGGLRKALAYTPSMVALGAVAFDAWLWKQPGIRSVVGRPWIGGTWVGTLTPHPESHIPEGGNRGPIDVSLVVEQSFWSMAVTLMSGEGSSRSVAAAIYPSGESRRRQLVTYTYTSSPNLDQRPRNQPHTGSAELEVSGSAPSRITGTYWTNRFTVGGIDLNLLNRRTDYLDYEAVRVDLSARGRA